MYDLCIRYLIDDNIDAFPEFLYKLKNLEEM